MIEELKHQVLDCDNDASIIQEAAKLLHRDTKSCKLDQLAKSHDGDSFFNMSHTQVASTISSLLSGKDLPLRHGGKVCCKDELEEKVLHLSQHILYAICKVPTPLYAICKVPTPLYAICKVPTPLTLGSAFYIYNETCSKNLITLLNHMNESVSYDTFQRKRS